MAEESVEPKAEAPKPKRRTRKQAEPTPKASEAETKKETAQPEVASKPDYSEGHADDKARLHAEEESDKVKKADHKAGKPAGRIVAEGEDIEVKTEDKGGVQVATETVYREVSIPGSKRKAYYLVAQEGAAYCKQTTIVQL